MITSLYRYRMMSTKIYESESTPSKYHFKVANDDFINQCGHIYNLIREQRLKIIHACSSQDDTLIESVVVDVYNNLFDIYTQEMPVLGYMIMNVSDSNPYWSYHYYSERYVEAKRRLFNGIRFLDNNKIEEFTWEMEGCFLALRVMGKMA
jgi:hypothetical protein